MNTRLWGTLQFLISIAIFVFGVRWFVGEDAASSSELNQQLVFFGLAVVGGFALAGLVQSVSGVPFHSLSSSFQALPRGQRKLIAAGVVSAIGLLMATGFAAYNLLSKA